MEGRGRGWGRSWYQGFRRAQRTSQRRGRGLAGRESVQPAGQSRFSGPGVCASCSRAERPGTAEAGFSPAPVRRRRSRPMRHSAVRVPDPCRCSVAQSLLSSHPAVLEGGSRASRHVLTGARKKREGRRHGGHRKATSSDVVHVPQNSPIQSAVPWLPYVRAVVRTSAASEFTAFIAFRRKRPSP